MVIGEMVYHTLLRVNLIVCQINSKGKVVCINPKIFDNDVFQRLTVDIKNLEKGWRQDL